MSATVELSTTGAPGVCAGWDYHVIDEVDSTSRYVARLPAWTAVRANTQTRGRGRTPERRWASDTGGLWLSAVVPCPGDRATWQILPLAAGWAVRTALRTLGVEGARLRWPNDIMVGRRKLAGLLVERFTADTAVVGIGLNITNDPGRVSPELAGAATRLADLLSDAPGVDAVAGVVLGALSHAHALIIEAGFGVIADDLNQAWREPRRIRITFAAGSHSMDGEFRGIDHQGRLRLATGIETRTYDAAQISLLRELE